MARVSRRSGYVCGHKKTYAKGRIAFFVDKLSISLSARRSYHSVFPNPRAARLKREMFKRFSPHQTLLGDFHSHRYSNRKTVIKNAGFNFSKADFECLIDDDFIWEAADNNPLMLMLAVCRMQHVRSGIGGWRRCNMFRFDVAEFRFRPNVAVGFLDENGRRRHTGNRSRAVQIEPFPFPVNFAGDRIDV